MAAAERQPLTLVMLAGLPGTGKTALALALGAALGWIVLDKDLIHSRLLGDSSISTQSGTLAYTLTLDLVEDILVRQQQSVILDTAGRQPMILARAQQITERSSARLVVLRCIVPAAIRASRIKQRIALPSQWVTDQATDADQERWYVHLPADTLTLDTQQPLNEILARALRVLQQHT